MDTTLPFGKFVFEHESFISGEFDTHFVKDYYSPEKLKAEQQVEKEIAAAVVLRLYLEGQKELKVAEVGESEWTARV
jgi:acetyl/propionyl-CoA carboxylase alpha subunit